MTDLFTLAELASKLQIAAVDNATASRARTTATSKVRAAAPRAFIAAGTHTVTRQALHGVVTLPRPVSSVTSVAWVNGNGTTTNATGWGFDGVDTISGLDTANRAVGAGPVAVPTATTVRITYVGGYAAVPQLVVDITLDLAARMYDNPRGLRSSDVHVGQFSEAVTFAGSGTDLAGTDLLAAERRALRPYRMAAASVRLG